MQERVKSSSRLRCNPRTRVTALLCMHRPRCRPEIKAYPAATRALIDQLVDRFLETYAVAADIPMSDRARLRERVAIYRTISLLRRSLRSWQKFKPGRIMNALALLEAELAELG